jgi:hypothetical protein
MEFFAQYSTVESSEIEPPEQPAASIEAPCTPLDGMKSKACYFIAINISSIRHTAEQRISFHGQVIKAHCKSL